MVADPVTAEEAPATETADPTRYEYTLRQFLMMKRLNRGFQDWSDVTDWVREWADRHDEVDLEEKKSYAAWEAAYPPSEL